MDPVTHGIAGALVGKAFFSKDTRGALDRPSTARVAVFASTLGAVFPDVDVFVEAFSHDPLGIARYHRGFTHSFIGLPVFALALAALTRWFFLRDSRRPDRKDCTPPSFAWLFLIYAAGIASHILLDGLTSFGTRMLNPFSKDRVAWDFVFIIDFILTALCLVPQLAAWVHRSGRGAARRAASMWVLLTLLAAAAWALARAAGFPFSLRAPAMASVVLALVFFVPLWRGAGARFSRAQWCRAGFCLALLYIAACGLAHAAAVSRVRAFALGRQLAVERLGAMPLPVSLFHWNGLILTPDGVYQSDFSLRSRSAPHFRFFANSAPNRYTRQAARLEPVGTFLWFARFPVMHFAKEGGTSVVEYADLRFLDGGEQEPLPFVFYVSFDSQDKMLKYGWVERARRFARTAPPGRAP